MADPFALQRGSALIVFELARLYLPRDPAVLGAEFDLAPLVVVEADRQNETTPRSGAAVDNEAERIVYWATSSIVLNGAEYDQVTYLWSCPDLSPLPDRGEGAVRWVRMTLGHDGFPIVWEVGLWGDTTSQNQFFVSKSLEEAARDEYGGALPGRQFATEPEVSERPETVVWGVVEDGPIPLGSYVYVSGARCLVTNVLCRCSPSKVEEIVASIYYHLEPLDPALALTPAPKSLTGALRWPPGL